LSHKDICFTEHSDDKSVVFINNDKDCYKYSEFCSDESSNNNNDNNNNDNNNNNGRRSIFDTLEFFTFVDVCDQRPWVRGAKALCCLAFIFGFLGLVILIFANIFDSKVLRVIGSLLTLLGFVAGTLCVVIQGLKSTKLTKDYIDAFSNHGYSENDCKHTPLPLYGMCIDSIFFYSFILVAVGSLLALIGGILGFKGKSKSGGTFSSN